MTEVTPSEYLKTIGSAHEIVQRQFEFEVRYEPEKPEFQMYACVQALLLQITVKQKLPPKYDDFIKSSLAYKKLNCVAADILYLISGPDVDSSDRRSLLLAIDVILNAFDTSLHQQMKEFGDIE